MIVINKVNVAIPGDESLVASVIVIGISISPDSVAQTCTVPSPSLTLTMVGIDTVKSEQYGHYLECL